MMKKTVIVIALSTLISGWAQAGTDSCQEQLNDIRAKLEQAQKSGNLTEQNNLKMAESKVNRYCTDERQAQRAMQDVKKKMRKVKKEEFDLAQANADLEEAKFSGDSRKIAKKERKLQEKKRDLEEAKMELKQAQDDYERLKK